MMIFSIRSISKHCVTPVSMLLLGLFMGCRSSEYSQGDGKAAAQSKLDFHGPQAATIRWQLLDSELMQTICNHRSLRELRLLTSTRNGAPVLSYVAEFRELESLDVIEVPLVDAELESLGELKNLTSLEFSQTGIIGSGLKYIANLPIKRLVIREKQLSHEGLLAIASMTELEELELCVPNVRVADLPSLASKSKLTSVKISNGCFSYRECGGLKCLIGATSLKHLSLSGNNLNDRSLQSISMLSNLEELSISNSMVSEDGVQILRRLSHLRSVEIQSWGTVFTNPTIRLAGGTDDEPVAQPLIRG